MSIGKQSFWGLAIKVCSIGVSFVVVTILARLLSPEAYGLYSVALATLVILAIPTALGLPNYVVRETAKSLSDGNAYLLRRIVSSAIKLLLLISIGVVSATLIWSYYATDAGEGSYRQVLWFGLGLIPLMALTQVLGAALRGIGQSSSGLFLGLVLRQALFLVLLAIWVLAVGTLTAVSAMALHLMAACLALVFGSVVWAMTRPKHGSSTSNHEAKFRYFSMLTSTGVMGVIAGAQTLNKNLDVIMVGALANLEAAGMYKLASTGALLAVAGLQAINLVMMPHFARLHLEGNTEKLQEIATKAVRLILITAVPVAMILIALGKPLISIVFGAEYLPSYTPMIILVTGQVVSALFGSVITILNMTGYEIKTMQGILCGSAINIALNAILIPPFGMIGAAIATASTLVAWNIYLHMVIRRHLRINTTPFKFLNITR